MRQRIMTCCLACDRRSRETREFPGKCCRTGDCYLLTEDGAHRIFERIPCSRSSQSRMPRNEWCKFDIACEMGADRFDIGIEVEHAAQPSDNGQQRAQLRQTDGWRAAI